MTFEEQLRSALERLGEHGPQGPVPDLAGRVRERDRRRRMTVVAAAAAFVVLVGAGIWGLQRHQDGQTVLATGGASLAALPAAPIAGRSDMASTWTGQQWLIWGGLSGQQFFGDGAAFDPATNRWSVLPAAPLQARIDPVSVWTGRQWLIWGGTSATTSFRDGAAYDPASRTWQRLPAAPGALPVDGNISPEGVWTGSELIIVTSTGHAAAYQPSTGRWRPVAAPPGTAAVPGGRAVWTGTSAIFLLGSASSVGGGLAGPAGRANSQPAGTDSAVPTAPATSAPMVAPRGPGDYSLFAYDPRTDHWTVLPPGGLQPGSEPNLIWTGRLLLTLDPVPAQTGEQANYPGNGYHQVTTAPGINAAYDPTTGKWTPLPAVPSSLADPGPMYTLSSAPPVWTGRSVLLWAGGTRGLSYTPDTASWSALAPGGGPARLRQATTWTGTELLGWGGANAANALQALSTGVRYQPLSTTPAPSPASTAAGGAWTSTPAGATPSTTVLENTVITYRGPIAGPYNDPDSGLILAPPPRDAIPAITWQQAAAPCTTTTGTSNCANPTSPEDVYLALGTDKSSGQVGPDNSITPLMDNTLVYVIVESLLCSSAGNAPPARPNPASTTTPKTITCTYLTFVNATTGEGLGGMSGPAIKPPSNQ